MSDEQLSKLIDAITAFQSTLWIQWIPIILTAVGLILALYQLRGIKRQISEDHERSRRVAAIDTVNKFLSSVSPEHNKIMNVLESMPREEIVHLRKGEPVKIRGSLKKHLCVALSVKFDGIYEKYCNDDSDIILDQKESMHLRYIMLDVLNTFEAAFIPWQANVADRDIIESQMKALVAPVNGQPKLSTARGVVGNEKFPATIAFIKKVVPELESQEKQPLGD